MTYLSIRLGRYEVFAQRETVNHTIRVTREGTGEVIVDLPFISLTFTKHRTSKLASSEDRDSL
jgi:hypothetical protein